LVSVSVGECAVLAWSPSTVLSGHTEKAGHFLQPTARATGHKVMGLFFRTARLCSERQRSCVDSNRPPGKRVCQRTRVLNARFPRRNGVLSRNEHGRGRCAVRAQDLDSPGRRDESRDDEEQSTPVDAREAGPSAAAGYGRLLRRR
jgi:hypothetical protein